MNKIATSLAGLLAAATLTVGCGAKSDTATATASKTAATEPTTTTLYIAPTTTTTVDVERVAMIAWASAHSGDMAPVTAALDKVRAISGQISTTAGNNIDNFTATNDADQLMAGADKIIALQEKEKTACLGVATAVKQAQKGLPVPVESINEPYSSALDHYLSASRACQVDRISEAATEISAGNADVVTATEAIEEYTAGSTR